MVSQKQVKNLITDLAGKSYYHGILARTVDTFNPLPSNITTTTFTLGATTNPITYYYQGQKIIVSSNKTATLTDGTSGLYYIYFDGVTGNILATKNFPGFDITSNILIATVLWNGTDYGLIYDERHLYNRDHRWHIWAHYTVGCRYRSGITLTHNGGTGSAATFATTAGEIADEDIEFVVNASSAFPTPNTCRLFWQTGANTMAFDKTASTVPFKQVGNLPQYVNSTYSLVTMSSAVNRFINAFVYVTTAVHTPITILVETVSAAVAADNGYKNVAAARDIPFPNLGSFGLSPEMKPIYRLIIRADGILQAIDTTQDDYRTVSSLPMAAGNVSTTASAVSFNPVGTISSTTVQTAIEELDLEAVHLTGNETISGIKTFTSCPLTPSGTPTTNFEVANKLYVDSVAGITPTLIAVESFTLTTNQTEIILTNTPIGIEYMVISINGIVLDQSLYTLADTTLTLLNGAGSQTTLDGTLITNQFPIDGDKLRVQIVRLGNIYSFDPLSIAALIDNTIDGSKIVDSSIPISKLSSYSKIYVDSFTATASQDVYTLSQTPIGIEYMNVSVNGVVLDQSLYEVSGVVLTLFAGAGSQLTIDSKLVANQLPRSGDKVRVQIMKETSISILDPLSFNTIADNSISGSKITSISIQGTKIVDNSISLAKLIPGGTSSNYTKGDNTFGNISEFVNITGVQSVNGVKTFIESPIIPTKIASTNDTSAASTAFVQSVNKVTTLALSAEITNNTTSAAKVTNLDFVVGVGTYAFKYYLLWQSAATSTGIKLSVNHTGTVTSFVANMSWVDDSAIAATGVVNQAQAAVTGGVLGANSVRAKSALADWSTGGLVGVKVQNVDNLIIIEGHVVVTVSGNLELYFASEVGTSTITIKKETALILTKIT